MIIPFFSKSKMLSDARIAPHFLPQAIDCDSGSALDRAIAKAFPHHKVFARALMEKEFEAEVVGSFTETVKGSRQQLEEFLNREAVTKNARVVFVVSVENGIRFKDFVFVFDTSAESYDVDDGLVRSVGNAIKKLKLPK